MQVAAITGKRQAQLVERERPRMMQTIRAVGHSLDKMITHRFPLSRVQDAWQLQLTGNCGKVLLYPWGDPA